MDKKVIKTKSFSGVLKKFGFKSLGVMRTDVVGYEKDNENNEGYYAEIITYSHFKEVWITGRGIPNKAHPCGMISTSPKSLEYILKTYTTNGL